MSNVAATLYNTVITYRVHSDSMVFTWLLILDFVTAKGPKSELKHSVIVFALRRNTASSKWAK